MTEESIKKYLGLFTEQRFVPYIKADGTRTSMRVYSYLAEAAAKYCKSKRIPFAYFIRQIVMHKPEELSSTEAFELVMFKLIFSGNLDVPEEQENV